MRAESPPRVAGTVVADTLRAAGVDHVFAVTGGHVAAVFDGLHRAGLRTVTFRDERSAAFAAAAYGALTRRPGVCLLTAGPGLSNGVTGLLQAHQAGWPVLSLGGRYETSSEGRGAMQELAQDELLASASKAAWTVRDPARIGEEVQRALALTLESPRGVVHLSLPVDVLATRAGEPAARLATGAEPAARLATGAEPAAPDAASVDAIAGLLAEAERPALILGPGAWFADAGAAALGLLERVRLPVLSHDEARGLVPDDHPLGAGDVLYGQTGATKLLREADLVITVGSKPDWRLSFLGPPQFAASARIVQISSREDDLAPVPGTVATVRADERLALEALARTPERQWPEWTRMIDLELAARRAALIARADDHAGPGVHPIHLVLEVARYVHDRDANVVIDGGNIGKWGKALLRTDRPGRLNRLKGPFAAIGHGVPSAIARRLTDPAHPVVLLTGDGSFGYSPLELETAGSADAPFLAVVAVDGAWGSVLVGQERAHGHGHGAAIAPVRFDELARAVGADGVWVEDRDGLREALAAVRDDRPTVIAVRSPTVAPPARYTAGLGY
jgi:acetolactate synthase I/II/III large subunit